MLKSDDGKKTTEFSVSVSSTAKAESQGIDTTSDDDRGRASTGHANAVTTPEMGEKAALAKADARETSQDNKQGFAKKKLTERGNGGDGDLVPRAAVLDAHPDLRRRRRPRRRPARPRRPVLPRLHDHPTRPHLPPGPLLRGRRHRRRRVGPPAARPAVRARPVHHRRRHEAVPCRGGEGRGN